jgi:NitT/TauT family transport system ATP-binding protein
MFEKQCGGGVSQAPSKRYKAVEGSRIFVEDLHKSYPGAQWGGRNILDGITFQQRPHEFVTIFGPNGAGKTTLIKIIAGLEDFDSGSVLIDGKPINEATPSRAIVFQDHALFDWKTVQENVEFGLKAKGIDRRERRLQAQHYINLVELTGHENKYPQELSGGLKQRTAIARALAVKPTILLMDEPFASLDTQVRRRLQDLVLDIWQQGHLTVLFVTHDADEAVLLSDRVLILSKAPALVIKDLRIHLPRPRHPEMRFNKEFQLYVHEIETAEINNN